MSLVLFFKPENRLAKLIKAPGGKLVDAAVTDADVELLQVSEQCLQEVDEALSRIYLLCETAPAESDLVELYQLVRDIAGLAGMCDLPDLGAGALSFCKFLDLAQDGGALSPEVVKVHLNVLRILRHPEVLAEEDRRQVLNNLEAMLEKLAKRAG